jgi:hypothetical protein
MNDDDECGAVGGMNGKGNWSTQKKTCPSAAMSKKILHDMTQAQTQATMVGSRWLTA